MQWLVLAPGEVADALKRHDHVVHSFEELGESKDDVLAAAASRQWDIITTDADLARKLFDAQKPFKRCIVYLQSAGAGSVDRLFERFKRLSPGRLYTVTESRVKVRQLPGG